MAAIQFTKFMSKSCQNSTIACSHPTSYSATTRKNNIIGTLGSSHDRLKLGRFQVDAVRLIAEGKAPRITQPQEGATYECIQKKDNSKVKCKMVILSLLPNTAVKDESLTPCASRYEVFDGDMDQTRCLHISKLYISLGSMLLRT